MTNLKTLLAACLVATGAAAHAEPDFSTVVAFGDSLSDNGNFYRLLDAATPLIPNDGLPPLPYFFGRLSNGPTAVEELAVGLGVPLDDRAVNGATTGTDNVLAEAPGTGVLAQVTQLVRKEHRLDHRALYVVWAGPNDFLSLAPGADVGQAIGTAVLNLSAAVTTLYVHGARHFLVPNMPDLGLTPRLKRAPAGAAEGATALTNVFNDALAGALFQLQQNLPRIDVKSFDTAGQLRQIVAAPGTFGFSDFTDVCSQTPDCILESFNAGPAQGFVFWDEIHPTASVHRLLGQRWQATVAP